MRRFRKNVFILFPATAIAAGGILMSASCSGSKAAIEPGPTVQIDLANAGEQGCVDTSNWEVAGGGEAAVATPKAQIYRMSGDYAGNVPVTLSSTGSLQSYPAPTDLSMASAPVKLADGWWLDRRGISRSTVFTSYTYPEYMALKQPPSPQEILAKVIPGARVTQLISLPVTTSQALADTAAVNRVIRNMQYGD